MSMRTYSSSWDGWTHPDPDYYVKLAGYKLPTEEGYDPVLQARVKDFVCPIDAKPPEVHGLGSSYVVLPDIVGTNLMDLTEAANRIPAAREIVFRHPLHERPPEQLGSHVSFIDGSAVLLSADDWQVRLQRIGESAEGAEPGSAE